VDYQYNAEDRLISATGDLESGASTSEYTYDAHGIRQHQTVDGTIARYLVDPTHQYAQVLEELDGTGNPVALYVIGHERISQTRAGGVHTYHADGLGSIRALTDETGASTDRYVYEAYGLLEHGEGTTPNDFRYTGEQYDPNLGFYYLRARYYNPATGRFPTMDTYQGRIHEPQTLHKYLYVHADPVNLNDPSGKAATLSDVMAGNLIIGTLAAVTVPQVVRVAVDNTPDGKFDVWDAVAASYFRSAFVAVSIYTTTATIGAWNGKTGPQRHHPIPFYLCGADPQRKSKLDHQVHVAVHAALAEVELHLRYAGEQANRVVNLGRKRQDDVVGLARTSEGRQVIANGIQLAYEPFWHFGYPALGDAFMHENPRYIGRHHSWPACKR
ncbi:MAG: RHS repeat-associated core domain-containing protein, partial [Wenzhouxiangella sp.]|nr:RHS repeat-associated core domain-containing protein [Wenzhouxiangella sp.]